MASETTSMATAAPKPGWKTTEFWLSCLLWALTAVLDSGAIPSASPAVKIVATICSTLKLLGYTASRTAVKTSASMLLVIVGLAMSQTACGPTTRETALRGGLTTLNAARDGLIAYSAQHQLDLARAAANEAAKERALAVFRAARAPVVDSMTLAYAALAAAALDKHASLPEVLAAIWAVVQAVKALREDVMPTSQPNAIDERRRRLPASVARAVGSSAPPRSHLPVWVPPGRSMRRRGVA